MAASTLVTASAWICIFYWLRRCRGASCTTAIIIVLGAMIASETILYVFSFIPRMIHCFLFAIAVLTQYAAIEAARRKPLPAEIKIKSASHGYFHFRSKERRQRTVPQHYCHRAFLMSIAIGFFEKASRRSRHSVHARHATAVRPAHRRRIHRHALGAPSKRQEEHHDYWRLGHYARLGIHRPFAVHNFPDRLDIGAVFGNAMNVTMTGFILYLIIAFSSYGHRDTYYYAIAGWAVFILPRSIVRVSSIGLYMQFPQPLCQRRCAAGCCSFPPSSSSFNSLCSNETKPLQPKRPR